MYGTLRLSGAMAAYTIKVTKNRMPENGKRQEHQRGIADGANPTVTGASHTEWRGREKEKAGKEKDRS